MLPNYWELICVLLLRRNWWFITIYIEIEFSNTELGKNVTHVSITLQPIIKNKTLFSLFSTLFMTRKKMKIDLKWFVAIQLDQEKCSHLRYFMLLNTKAQITTHGMTLASITNWINSYHKLFSKWIYLDRNNHSNAFFAP